MNIFKKQTHASEPSSIKNGWRNVASTVLLLISAPILAVLMTVYVFQSYEVFGLSMDTTLQDGDRLVVQKFSKNWAKLRGVDYVPQRGEIIVFDKPASLASTNEVKHLIKRVLALPGEQVVVANNKITIYNQENPEGFNPDDGEEWAKDIIATPGNVNITVGQREFFAVGDNRTNSQDSRAFGAVSIDSITGVAKLRFIPINMFESF